MEYILDFTPDWTTTLVISYEEQLKQMHVYMKRNIYVNENRLILNSVTEFIALLHNCHLEQIFIFRMTNFICMQ